MNNAENRNENNNVVLAGEVAGTPVYSHEVFGDPLEERLQICSLLLIEPMVSRTTSLVLHGDVMPAMHQALR